MLQQTTQPKRLNLRRYASWPPEVKKGVNDNLATLKEIVEAARP